jgi:hypothetical protein
MNFSFELLYINIIHLAQLPILNMTLKKHHINICNNFYLFFNHQKCFLDHLIVIALQKHIF